MAQKHRHIQTVHGRRAYRAFLFPHTETHPLSHHEQTQRMPGVNKDRRLQARQSYPVLYVIRFLWKYQQRSFPVRIHRQVQNDSHYTQKCHLPAGSHVFHFAVYERFSNPLLPAAAALRWTCEVNDDFFHPVPAVFQVFLCFQHGQQDKFDPLPREEKKRQKARSDLPDTLLHPNRQYRGTSGHIGIDEPGVSQSPDSLPVSAPQPFPAFVEGSNLRSHPP